MYKIIFLCVMMFKYEWLTNTAILYLLFLSLIPCHPSLGTFVISYFAACSSETNFLGFTYFLCRIFLCRIILCTEDLIEETDRIFLASRNPVVGKVKFLVRPFWGLKIMNSCLSTLYFFCLILFSSLPPLFWR